MIPVVRGAANYSLYAPKHWFIDANNFQHPKDLAAYLKKVGSNFTLFSEYLKDREQFTVVQQDLRYLKSWCELCKKLNNKKEPKKVYNKIDTWWSSSDCTDPRI